MALICLILKYLLTAIGEKNQTDNNENILIIELQSLNFRHINSVIKLLFLLVPNTYIVISLYGLELLGIILNVQSIPKNLTNFEFK